MKPSVYIETSVVSAAVDLRDDPITQAQHLITVDWWTRQAPRFDLFYSEAVEIELLRFPFPGQQAALALLKDMTPLPLTPAIDGVAETYRLHLVMPNEPLGDAVHLAVACVHEVDYLLTWNCRHIANTNKIRHIQAINMRLGLLTPTLLTPEMLVAEEPEQ